MLVHSVARRAQDGTLEELPGVGPKTAEAISQSLAGAVPDYLCALLAAWSDAELEASQGSWAWRRFRWDWDAEAGEHMLRVRAHDESGRVQPQQQDWYRGGFANNGDEALRVVVMEA